MPPGVAVICTELEFQAALARIKELAAARHGTAEGKELEAVMVAVHEFEAKSPAVLSRPW